MLLFILDAPAPPDVRLTSENQTFVHCERDNGSYCMAQHINLVVCQSPGENQSRPKPFGVEGKCAQLGLVKRNE